MNYADFLRWRVRRSCAVFQSSTTSGSVRTNIWSSCTELFTSILSWACLLSMHRFTSLTTTWVTKSNRIVIPNARDHQSTVEKGFFKFTSD